MVRTLSRCGKNSLPSTTGTDITRDLWGREREEVLSALNMVDQAIAFHEDFRLCLQEAITVIEKINYQDNISKKKLGKGVSNSKIVTRNDMLTMPAKVS